MPLSTDPLDGRERVNSSRVYYEAGIFVPIPLQRGQLLRGSLEMSLDNSLIALD